METPTITEDNREEKTLRADGKRGSDGAAASPGASAPAKQPGGAGFLENVFFGRFPRELFEGVEPSRGPDERSADILRRYRTLIADYPAARLEALGEVPSELWRGLKAMGFFGLNIPERYGGQGLSTAQYLQVLRAVARTDMALAIIPTAHLSIGVKAILLFGSPEQKARYLPTAASGEMLFAYALTEPATGSDAAHIETTARRSGDGSHYVLNGTKTYITNGGYAGGFTVFAQLDREKPGRLGAFIVEKAWPGVRVGRPMPKMGLTISSTTSVSFHDVRVPAENLVGREGDGFRIAMSVLNYGRLGLGAASTGAMEQSLDDMIDRARSRRQFGRPIADFELIREKIVRARVHGAVAAAMTWFAADLLDGDPTGVYAIESSHTKLYGTTRAWDTLYDALQTAGGAGYLSTQPYEKRMRDFRVTTLFEGTTEIHSIYPALFLLRRLGRDPRTGRRSRLRGWMRLLIGAIAGLRGLDAGRRPGAERDALTLVRQIVRALRFRLVAGSLRYGRRIADRQYLLRRVTEGSLYVFGLLALAADLAARRRAGESVESEAGILEAVTLEAREVLERLRHGEGRKEKLYRKLFAEIAKRRGTVA